MRDFWKAVSGRIRPVLCLALLLLVGVLWMSLSSLDHSGMYVALQDAIMLDVPEARMQALFTAMDKLSQTQIHEKIILAVIIAFSGCISLLSQPNPPEQETASDIIKAMKAQEDEEKEQLKAQVGDLTAKINKLHEALGGD